MAKGKKPKSWAEQLADLEDPAPKGWYESTLHTRSNIFQSLIQKTMPDSSKKIMAQARLAMTRI